MEDNKNIHREYEALFGSSKRVNLFDTDEEYSVLRQYILSSPKIEFVSSCLLFDNAQDVNKFKKLIKKKDADKFQVECVQVLLSEKVKKSNQYSQNH